MLTSLRTLPSYWELIKNLAVRDLKVRYKKSVLGVLWAFLEPLIMMLIFTAIFSLIVRLDVENYAVFFLCGLLPWNFFATSVIYSSSSIINDASIIKKIYFPREIFSISVAIARLINFALSLIVLLVFLLAFRIPITFALIYLPVIVLIQFILILGFAFLFSALNVFYNDVGFVLQFLMQLWFFLTPIIYPISMVPERYLSLYMLNPMTPVISAYKDIFYSGQAPDLGYLGMSLGMAAVVFVVGYSVFKSLEPRFAEVL